MSTVFLSHALGDLTPGFAGQKSFFQQTNSKISEGRSSNSSEFRLSSHVGTHVDVPYHFDDAGKKLNFYPAEHWHFKTVCLLELPAAPDAILELQNSDAAIAKVCDLLLIRTGFEAFRQQEIYWKNNPGVSVESALFLKKNRPSLRCIGFDFISLTAFQSRELGRAAHRAFLGSENGPPICIIEDMKLSNWQNELKQVVVAPLLVENADGAPVTVMAF